MDRFESTDFSYFRQISFALATITLCFAFLLIATLLTVSVNQRLAEIATLRALGFPRRRVAADLLWESALLIGTGAEDLGRADHLGGERVGERCALVRDTTRRVRLLQIRG